MKWIQRLAMRALERGMRGPVRGTLDEMWEPARASWARFVESTLGGTLTQRAELDCVARELGVGVLR